MRFVSNAHRRVSELFVRVGARVHGTTRAALLLAARSVVAVFSRIEARDVSLWLGLAGFGYGASLWWLPLAFMGPGVVLIWIALPRPPRRDLPVEKSIAEDR